MSDFNDSDNDLEIENDEKEEEKDNDTVKERSEKKKLNIIEDENDRDEESEDNGEENEDDDIDEEDLLFLEEEDLDKFTKEIDSSKKNSEKNSENLILENSIQFSNDDKEFSDKTYLSPINSDVESDDEEYFEKFTKEIRDDHIKKFYPESLINNSVEIELLTKIERDENNNIIDKNHKTLPFLSKYERTRILGQRAKQINIGDKPYIDVPPHIIDGYLIAELELNAKKIPVIIRRPLPGGKSEYWKIQDLEIL